MQSYRQQRGIVLVMALVVLLALALIGLITLQSSQMQERITSNIRQMGIAMQTADSALREAETNINGMSGTTAFNNSNGLYAVGQAPDPFASATWTGTASITSTATYPSNIVPPQYFIEYLGIFATSGSSGGTNSTIQNYGYTSATGGSGSSGVYRIVARGTGGGKSQIIYESYFAK